MNINVTKHAVKRYRQRLFDYTSAEEKIIKTLKEIVKNGRKISQRPSSVGVCVEIYYRGISVVLLHTSNEGIIITCLGDKSYRKWIKHQDRNIRLAGRVLYPEIVC